jgi:hypothetical protein
MSVLTLLSLPDTFAIAQLSAGAATPEWAMRGPFFSITRTMDELSVVCRNEDVPAEITAERGWRCLQVVGKLEFAMIGILASLLIPLGEAGVSVLAISAFDTDYVLVREWDFALAVGALQQAGHYVVSDRPADPT